MSRLFIIAIAFLISFPVYGQKVKSTLQTEINTNFPDNTVGFITPSLARSTFTDFLNSWQQYAGVNAQTGITYTIQLSDYGQLLTFSNASSVAVSMPQASGSFSSFNTYVENLGAGTATITPTTSTICGASTLVLTQNQSAWIVSDGTNYQCWKGFFSGAIPLNVASGGTGLTSGTSGGLPYFNSSTSMLSSGVLALNQIILGGGVAGSPATLGSLGTTTTVLHGNASGAPSFGSVVQGDIANNAVGNAQLAQAVNNTIKGNVSGGTANESDLTGGQVGSMLCVPQATILTTGTAQTYSTPTCNSVTATWLEVDVQGGGGGGAGSGTTVAAGTTGNSSSFGALTASGGSGAPNEAGGAGGACSGSLGTQDNYPGSAGAGTQNVAALALPGGAGGVSYYGGFGAPVFNAAGQSAPANSGGGGSGGASNATAGVFGGGGGGAGCHIRSIIAGPAATITYTVGAAVSGGSAGTSGSTGGGGSAGRIVVIAHWQ